MKTNNTVLIGIVVGIIVVGGGLIYYFTSQNQSGASATPAAQTSMTTQQSSGQSVQYSPAARPSGQRGAGGRGGRQLPAGSKPIFGQITAVNGSQFTVQQQGRNGGSSTTLTVNITSSTQFNGGSQSDLAVGTRVGGYGTANSDGSINAQTIMINPQFRGRPQSSNNPNPS